MICLNEVVFHHFEVGLLLDMQGHSIFIFVDLCLVELMGQFEYVLEGCVSC